MTDPDHRVRPFPITAAGPTPPVTVSVDKNHCQLYGVCAQEAPTVFDLGTDGRLRYQSRPDDDSTQAVTQAARCCPTQAINLTERRR